jgi:NCS1 family nucleobase:cation symporter-1
MSDSVGATAMADGPHDLAPGRALEVCTIQPIPLDQRHGRARDLFSLWFGSNLIILTVATGALCTTIFDLTLAAAAAAIVIGNLVGGIFMALHAAQGPRLGVPQMVQTRGQFGTRGALAVILVVAVMDVGFVASNLVLGAESLHSAAPPLPVISAILLIAVVAALAAMFGHDMIHRFTRWNSWLCGIAILVAIGLVLAHHPVFPGGQLRLAAFLGAVSTGVLWQIAYAPYVSDYSRYLPADTGARPAFWASYSGCVLGSILPMLLGAMLGRLYPSLVVSDSLTLTSGAFAVPVVILMTAGIAAASAISLYCGTLAVIAVGQTFLPGWDARARARILLSVVLALVATGVALAAGPRFMESYTNFLLLLLYVMVPWTAINLVDYYLVRHGDYDVASFLRADGGIYGRYNGPALAAYAFGILIQIPFVSNALYTGAIAARLGGVDLSWIVGLVVVGPAYLLLARRRTT